MFQCESMKSTASQSSNSGCDGSEPCVPKSSSLTTRPVPNNWAHTRLTITRAVNGLSRLTSQCAKPSRLRGASAGNGWNAAGTAASTASPSERKFPLIMACVARRLSAGSSRKIGMAAICFSASSTCFLASAACFFSSSLAASACAALSRGTKSSPQLGQMNLFVDCGRSQTGLFVAPVGVFGLIEEGIALIVFTLRDRIELVAMALGAAHRQPHPDLHRGFDAVLDRRHAKLLVVGPALVVGHRVAMKRRGQLLVVRGAGQQVARQLLDGELVERSIRVERFDHPIAISPNRAQRVGTVTLAVGIAGQVEPHPSPAFAIGRIGQRPIDHSLIGPGLLVIDKSRGLLGRGRQADQVQVNSSHQHVFVGFGRRFELFLFDAGQHKRVEWAARPIHLLDRGERSLDRLVPGPMRRSRGNRVGRLRPKRAGLHPALDQIDFGRG